MLKVGSKLRRELLSYLEVRSVYELANIDEMSKELQKKMRDGKVMLNKLKQYKFSPKTKEEMMNEFTFLFEEEATPAPVEKEENQTSPQEPTSTNDESLTPKEEVTEQTIEQEPKVEEQPVTENKTDGGE